MRPWQLDGAYSYSLCIISMLHVPLSSKRPFLTPHRPACLKLHSCLIPLQVQDQLSGLMVLFKSWNIVILALCPCY